MTNEAKMKMKMKTKTSTKHNADDDDDSNDDDDDAETSNYPNQPDQEHAIPEQNRPEQDDKRKPPARRSSNGARGKAPNGEHGADADAQINSPLANANPLPGRRNLPLFPPRAEAISLGSVGRL